MRVRSLLALIAVAFSTLPVTAQTAPPPPDRLERVLKTGTLRVGTTMDTPVFSMRNAAGELHGFDMDALATLSKALGVRIDYVKMTFGTMLPDLLADKFAQLPGRRDANNISHKLLDELSVTPEALLDLINSASRLKMAVRGWVAETHL